MTYILSCKAPYISNAQFGLLTQSSKHEYRTTLYESSAVSWLYKQNHYIYTEHRLYIHVHCTIIITINHWVIKAVITNTTPWINSWLTITDQTDIEVVKSLFSYVAYSLLNFYSCLDARTSMFTVRCIFKIKVMGNGMTVVKLSFT